MSRHEVARFEAAYCRCASEISSAVWSVGLGRALKHYASIRQCGGECRGYDAAVEDFVRDPYAWLFLVPVERPPQELPEGKRR